MENENKPVVPGDDIMALDREVLINLQKMVAFFNKQPDPANIKRNKFANNSEFLPISMVETQLDETFFGLWQTENFKTKLIANEIVGEIDLKVFHPVTKQWISRTGAAAVQVQQKANTEIDTIGQNKIKNTLVKDYPHLKAECVKNAAKSIGKSFGRDLNRKDVDTYNPLIKPEDESVN